MVVISKEFLAYKIYIWPESKYGLCSHGVVNFSCNANTLQVYFSTWYYSQPISFHFKYENIIMCKWVINCQRANDINKIQHLIFQCVMSALPATMYRPTQYVYMYMYYMYERWWGCLLQITSYIYFCPIPSLPSVCCSRVHRDSLWIVIEPLYILLMWNKLTSSILAVSWVAYVWLVRLKRTQFSRGLFFFSFAFIWYVLQFSPFYEVFFSFCQFSIIDMKNLSKWWKKRGNFSRKMDKIEMHCAFLSMYLYYLLNQISSIIFWLNSNRLLYLISATLFPYWNAYFRFI